MGRGGNPGQFVLYLTCSPFKHSFTKYKSKNTPFRNPGREGVILRTQHKAGSGSICFPIPKRAEKRGSISLGQNRNHKVGERHSSFGILFCKRKRMTSEGVPKKICVSSLGCLCYSFTKNCKFQISCLIFNDTTHRHFGEYLESHLCCLPSLKQASVLKKLINYCESDREESEILVLDEQL